MNISYRWLRALAPGLEDDPAMVAARLAGYGMPVESMERPGEAIGDVVVARVLDVKQHPNADRLSLCTVEAGNGVVEVVCGATNVRADRLYPFAPVGATLPGGVQIGRAKIRGVVSHGMLCSERELGLGRTHEGIMELRGAFRPGQPLSEALGLDDVRLEVEVTPNRGDLLSHRGVAIELAPGGVHGIELPSFPDAADASLPEPAVDAREAAADDVPVRIDDAAGCPRYMGAVVRGVRVGPSPEWLASRLRSVGARPINNVVDATNYVLLELGQPLHAFDLARLEGPAILVRRAGAGERIVTLDGETRALEPQMLVIADARQPVAIAGVMGGENSEVDADTSDVLLECALFDARSIRATRTALNMSTDASYRFERSVDPEGVERALRRALELIVTVAGGEVTGVADVRAVEAEAPVVPLRVDRVERVLGARIEEPRIVALLEPLGFQRLEDADGALRFRVPGSRWADTTREVDLIEEVARRHGYDALPDELRGFRPGSVPDDPLAALADRLRDVLVAEGLLEHRGLPLGPADEGDVAVLKPLSQEASRLRRSLVPGLRRAVELNYAAGVRDVRLFELGTVFAPGRADEQPIEHAHVAAVLTGARRPPHWSEPDADVDLFDAKALAERLARALGLGADAVAPAADEASWRLLDPGDLLEPAGGFVIAAHGVTRGVVGRLRQQAIDAPAWAAPVWALELQLGDELAARPEPVLRPVPTQPASERDLALLVPQGLSAAAVGATIEDAAGELLEDVRVFDVYEGAGVPEGVRSVAYRLRFRAPDRTLTDEEVEAVVARVLDRLRTGHGITRR